MMKIDPRDWPAISALFDQALDMPAPQRRRWLEELPQGQRAHRHTLELLLADHAAVETQNFLHTLPKVGVVDEPVDDAPDDAERTVGPYRLLRELGRGGMGTVWLAERVDGVLKRRVALKLPHPGLATRTFGERLARERDILASLAHAHIARLYDAGVTAQGQPYIALAYVEGQTLVEHCEARRLGLRERIALFQQVLEAVQYAHAHLVIHRDLKPSNVLVDDQGQVQLLDFGIAKLLVDGQAEATELTLDAGQALTPDYASPEQIGGGAITTASDVYSLGVLLFELLAGIRPYRLERHGQAGLERALLEIDMPRPSTAARGAGDLPTARALRGDLDTIVLKALQTDPANRYPTADAFRQDLQRYLDGTAVLARPDAVAYRVGKFIRRHRVGVTLTVLVVLSLGAGLAGTAWQARQATQQAERAQAVQDFLIGLFDEADPAKAQGRELTARQMVDRGRRDVLVKLANQPKLHALLDGVLVDLYTKLGDENKALPLAEAHRDLTLRLDGAESLGYGDALYALARVQGGLNRHALAYETFQQAHAVLQHHGQARAGELLSIDGQMAIQLAMLDRTQEAVNLLTRLLPRLEAHFGSGSWELLRYEAVLAGAYSDQGEYAKAEQLIAQIAPRLDGADAAHAIAAAEMRVDLGYAMWNARRYQAAEVLLERGIADADRLLGPANTLTVAAQRTLGLLFDAQGRFDLAAKTFDDSVQTGRAPGRRRLFGDAICRIVRCDSTHLDRTDGSSPFDGAAIGTQHGAGRGHLAGDCSRFRSQAWTGTDLHRRLRQGGAGTGGCSGPGRTSRLEQGWRTRYDTAVPRGRDGRTRAPRRRRASRDAGGCLVCAWPAQRCGDRSLEADGSTGAGTSGPVRVGSDAHRGRARASAEKGAAESDRPPVS